MQLIARVSVRRHEMADGGEEVSRPRPGRSVAIFRILGHSPAKALKTLTREISTQADSLVALAIESAAMTATQQAVYETVIAECHRLSAPVLTCGGDPAQLGARPLAGYLPDPWFPSVPSMMLELGEGDLQPGGRRAASRN